MPHDVPDAGTTTTQKRDGVLSYSTRSCAGCKIGIKGAPWRQRIAHTTMHTSSLLRSERCIRRAMGDSWKRGWDDNRLILDDDDVEVLSNEVGRPSPAGEVSNALLKEDKPLQPSASSASTTETKPAATAPKPASTSSTPASTTETKPAATAPKPASTSSTPASTTETKPAATAPKPASTSSTPAPTTETKPAATAPKPASSSSNPASRTETKPAATAPKPASTSSTPASRTATPASTSSTPASTTPASTTAMPMSTSATSAKPTTVVPTICGVLAALVLVLQGSIIASLLIVGAIFFIEAIVNAVLAAASFTVAVVTNVISFVTQLVYTLYLVVIGVIKVIVGLAVLFGILHVCMSHKAASRS